MIKERLEQQMDRELIILILEDVATDAELMVRELKKGKLSFISKRVETKESFIKELKEFSPDVILSDYKLPNFDGISALRMVKELSPSTPFIIVTGSMNEDIAVGCIKAGAWDYIIKENFTRLVSAVRGALEKKRIKDEKEQAEEFIKNILESIGEGLIVLDREYRIISGNKAFCVLSRKTDEEIKGRHCFEISHNLNRPCFEIGEDCPVKKTFETGNPHIVVHTHKDTEGNEFDIEARAYPMKDESGNIISVIEIINDISEKKKLESQLRHAQKMEAIGQLTGGIAHDFNNILNAIIGFSTLIEMNIHKDETLRSHLNEIFKATERATTLTHSLFAFSRKQIITPQPVKLNEVVKTVEKLLIRLVGEDIELKTLLTKEDMTVMADAGQIEQVLMNLATNARDAMPDGGLLTIETGIIELDEEFVKSHKYGKPGRFALISVSDTGTGMDEHTRERIFEPFFTTKELDKGTGLGLSMVYGIIKQHSGYINVYSEPGKGTTFKIYLPVAEVEIEEMAEPSKEVPITQLCGTEAILVAEDDESLMKLSRTVLTQMGYTVIEAVDGEDAVDKFMENKEKIKLLIMDIIMPKKNGKEVYEEIRKIEPDIKAIFVSGYPADIIHKRGILKEGMNFILKPVSLIELLRKVREVLDN